MPPVGDLRSAPWSGRETGPQPGVWACHTYPPRRPVPNQHHTAAGSSGTTPHQPARARNSSLETAPTTSRAVSCDVRTPMSRVLIGVAAKMLRKKVFFEETLTPNSPIRPNPRCPAFSHSRHQSDLRHPLPTAPRLIQARLYECPHRRCPPNLSPSCRPLSNSRRRPLGFLFCLAAVVSPLWQGLPTLPLAATAGLQIRRL